MTDCDYLPNYDLFDYYWMRKSMRCDYERLLLKVRKYQIRKSPYSSF